MKAGVTTSVVAHAVIIVVAMVGLGTAKPFEPEVIESIAVDLVPLSEFTNIRAGSLDSQVVETETPAVAESETPPEIAQPTGNTQEDQVTPQETAKVTPAPVINTAPEPVPEPQPEPEPEPVKEPTPEPEPVAAPEPTPVEPTPVPEEVTPPPELATPVVTPEPTEVAPAPAMRTAALDQMRADYKKELADKKKKAEEEKKKVADAKIAAEKKKKEDEAKRVAQAKAAADKQAREADQVAALINNEDSRGATTGQGGTPTLGKNTGTSATLSQSEIGALAAAMKACFSPPPGSTEEDATAQVEVKLTREGFVAGTQVLAVTGPTTGQATGSAAVRAVQRCGQNGYAMLPAAKYDGAGGWNTVKVTFKANESF
ncbi:MAG: hypothetical protein ABL879_16125 [Devosia sp.]